MQSKQAKEETKQAYEKPRLRTIELAAEEVLGIGCKISGSATINVGQINCGIGTSCILDGS